jgi:hypothetical protein
VWAHLYNNVTHDPAHLAVAQRARDFLLQHCRTTAGEWRMAVDRDGAEQADGELDTVGYCAMFAAEGTSLYY